MYDTETDTEAQRLIEMKERLTMERGQLYNTKPNTREVGKRITEIGEALREIDRRMLRFVIKL